MTRDQGLEGLRADLSFASERSKSLDAVREELDEGDAGG